jgi:hypothetical protein
LQTSFEWISYVATIKLFPSNLTVAKHLPSAAARLYGASGGLQIRDLLEFSRLQAVASIKVYHCTGNLTDALIRDCLFTKYWAKAPLWHLELILENVAS